MKNTNEFGQSLAAKNQASSSYLTFVALLSLVLLSLLVDGIDAAATHRMDDVGVCTTNHNCIEKCADDQVNSDILTWLGSNEPRLAQFQGKA